MTKEGMYKWMNGMAGVVWGGCWCTFAVNRNGETLDRKRRNDFCVTPDTNLCMRKSENEQRKYENLFFHDTS